MTPVNLSNTEAVSKNIRTELIIQFLKRAFGTLQACWQFPCTFILLSYLENHLQQTAAGMERRTRYLQLNLSNVIRYLTRADEFENQH